MRLVFAGTPDAAVPSLGVLAASDHDVVAVITRRASPARRSASCSGAFTECSHDDDRQTLEPPSTVGTFIA